MSLKLREPEGTVTVWTRSAMLAVKNDSISTPPPAESDLLLWRSLAFLDPRPDPILALVESCARGILWGCSARMIPSCLKRFFASG